MMMFSNERVMASIGLQIARCEHIRIETGAVAEIINICAQDLRSSINALQFIAVESSSGVIDLNAVRSVCYSFHVLSFQQDY